MWAGPELRPIGCFCASFTPRRQEREHWGTGPGLERGRWSTLPKRRWKHWVPVCWLKQKIICCTCDKYLTSWNFVHWLFNIEDDAASVEQPATAWTSTSVLLNIFPQRSLCGCDPSRYWIAVMDVENSLDDKLSSDWTYVCRRHCLALYTVRVDWDGCSRLFVSRIPLTEINESGATTHGASRQFKMIVSAWWLFIWSLRKNTEINLYWSLNHFDILCFFYRVNLTESYDSTNNYVSYFH